MIQEKLNFIKYQKEKFMEEHSLKIELLKKKIELTEYKLSKKWNVQISYVFFKTFVLAVLMF